MASENKTVVWIRRQITPADKGSQSTAGGILSIQEVKSAQNLWLNLIVCSLECSSIYQREQVAQESSA